jgi:hypothetical protein
MAAGPTTAPEPIAFLLDSGEPAVRFLTRQDLFDQESHDGGRLLTTGPKGLGPADLFGAGFVCCKLPPCAPARAEIIGPGVDGVSVILILGWPASSGPTLGYGCQETAHP